MTENAISKNNHLDRCNTFSFFHIYTEEHVVNKNIFLLYLQGLITTGHKTIKLQNFCEE